MSITVIITITIIFNIIIIIFLTIIITDFRSTYSPWGLSLDPTACYAVHTT